MVRFILGRALSDALIRSSLLSGALCALALSGCTLPEQVAGLSESPVDSSSPVAQDVIQASRHPGPYPKFADIPKVPTDLRPASGWREAVQDMQHRQAVLESEVAALPPVTSDAEAYAADTRTRMGPPVGAPPPAEARQMTEAEARALRKRATPPPLPK